MTTESFEYAVKKDVRNNPIVREVDRGGTGCSAVGTVVLSSSALFCSWQQFVSCGHGIASISAQTGRRGRGERHLGLESKVGAPALIEQKATSISSWRACLQWTPLFERVLLCRASRLVSPGAQ